MPRPRASFKALIEELESTTSPAALNKKIIESLADLKSEEQQTLFGFACHMGLLPAVQHIIGKSPQAINAQTDAVAYFSQVQKECPFTYKTLTPLQAAMANPNSSRFKLIDWLLLQPHLNLNEKQGAWDVETVFYVTSLGGKDIKKQQHLFSNLLKAGLNLIPSPNHSSTLLIELLQDNNLDFFKLALSHPLDWSKASATFKKKFQSELEMELDFYADALYSLFSKDQKEIIKLLIHQDLPDDFKIKKRLEAWCPEEVALLQQRKLNESLPSAPPSTKITRL